MPDAMDDYMVLGVWLNRDSQQTTTLAARLHSALSQDGVQDRVRDACSPHRDGDISSGAATGLYTAGSSVDYFQGAATLMANFGEAPEAPETGSTTVALGTITGMIDNIVAGGNEHDRRH